MPTFSSMHLPKPKSWDEFEDMVCDAMKIRWHNPDFTRHGRQGQAQQGVDIYGNNDSNFLAGIQCKNTILSIDMDVINKELNSAEAFTPEIKALYIATTADTDSDIQKCVRLISEEREKKGRFPVLVLFWNDLQQELVKDKVILKKYYPQIFIATNGSEYAGNKKLCVLGIAYRGLRISEYIALLFGEMGMLADEDPGQLTQLCVEIKACSEQIFKKGQYKSICKDLNEIETLCFKRYGNKEESDLRWSRVMSLAKIVEKKIKVLETMLSDELLKLFVLGEILAFLDMVIFDTFEEYHATVVKYHQKIIDGFKLLRATDVLLEDIDKQLKYAESDDSFKIFNMPSRLYSTAKEMIKG